MKILNTLKKLPLLVLVVLVSFACSDDDDNNTPPVMIQEMNIVETAQGTESLSSLVAAVLEANLATTLSSAGPFTVLAPTNEAFAEFLNDNGWATVADIPDAALEQVLLNHVISGSVMASDLISGGAGYASTNATGAGGNKMSIYYDTSNGVRFNNISTVTTADVTASNGVVHIVDQVIGLPSIVDHAVANSGFSKLVAALMAADGDLVNVLSGDGPFTVLAPDDMAFTNFLDGAALGDIPTDALSQVLLNHVVGGAISSSDLVGTGSGYANTSATGAGDNALSLYFDTMDGVTFNGSSSVIAADVIGTNGIIHAVDAVIDLPTIATFATSNPALSILVESLAYADTGSPTVPYINTVSDSAAGPFTVFAPTNDAFGNLLTDLGATALTDIPTATVDTVLLLHIVGGNIQSSGLPNGDVATVGGGIITADNTAFTLTNDNGTSNIITSLVDIQATNGVVHVIDRVIR